MWKKSLRSRTTRLDLDMQWGLTLCRDTIINLNLSISKSTNCSYIFHLFLRGSYIFNHLFIHFPHLCRALIVPKKQKLRKWSKKTKYIKGNLLPPLKLYTFTLPKRKKSVQLAWQGNWTVCSKDLIFRWMLSVPCIWGRWLKLLN